MTPIARQFQALREQGRKAFVPFVTAGDPHLEFTAAVVRTLAAAGSHLCEIGFPYSDPIADGPVIQTSYSRALKSGIQIVDILAMTRSLANELSIPLVGMVSVSLVHRQGLAAFVKLAASHGLAGLIVPDLPGEESGELAGLCRDHAMDLIQLISPTTTEDRARRIVRQASGFIYLVSSTGVTGERTELPADLLERIRWLRQETDLPICVGFGISQPWQVAHMARAAEGVIVGSAIVRCLSDAEPEVALAKVSTLVRELIAPLQ